MNKLLLHILLIVLVTSTTCFASNLQLPVSGQINSQAAGDDGAVQAGKPWPIPRFVDNRNGTIKDNLSGLIWSGDANPLSTGFDGTGIKGEVTWQKALDEIRKLNAGAYLGFSDWRLPNLNELASLVHQGEPVQNLWLNRNGFANTAAAHFWSSSSVISFASKAWAVHMDGGSVGALQKTGSALVWPVRGTSNLPATGQTVCYDTTGVHMECSGAGQDGELRMGVLWPVIRFSDNGDGTITDNATGLIWPQNANPAMATLTARAGDGSLLWPDALEIATNLNNNVYLGYSDWRLPNRVELVSLVNYAESNPGIQLNMVGVEGIQERYWSSGTSAANPANAWNVAMNGEVTERGKYDLRSGSYLWPVRGGIETLSSSLLSGGTQSKALVKSVAAVAAAAVTLSVTTTSLPAGTTGTSYSQTLTATGGTTPYTWSKKSGTLPAGLALSTAGVISGTPTTAGTSTFTVQVKDKSAKTATKSLSITISAGVLAISTATVADGYLATTYSQTLTATGGKTAYTWSITIGSLPTGLTLAASTGKISGTPTTTGTSSFTVQVKDANNTIISKSLTITVYTLPSITTTSLPSGGVGTAYSQTLAATGGKTTYVWSISTGTMPAGLTLAAATGVISGIPTTAATSSVTFKVTDANAKTATKALSITVTTTPPVITTAGLSDGVVAVTYSQTLTATGGKTPYTWTRTSGSLPTGMTLSTAGVISGKPTATGTSSFTVQVKDANNAVATKSLSITVAPQLGIVTTDLPNGVVGSAYNQFFSASGGKLPYTWSITTGTLPAGLVLDASSGAVSGMPTTSEWSYFTIQVKDANNSIASVPTSLYIFPPLNITTTMLPGDYVNIPYNQTLVASGGTLPYTWTLTGGDLPAGLGLDPASGAISGTPTIAGTGTFTVQVRDAGNVTASAALSISIATFGSISGVVSDQATGAPLTGVDVTLKIDYTNNNPNDKIYSCNNVAVTSVDYVKIAENDGIKFSCPGTSAQSTMQFKLRNPFGVTDPFTVNWNGIGTHLSSTEYLAQSFKPTRSGSLNKVGFYLPYALSTYLEGSVHVLLKSRLGGDRGSYLAISNNISLGGVRGTTPTWVDFTFPTPVQVTAGQEYFLEINGTFFEWFGNGANLYSLLWSAATSYPDGKAYQRSNGLWSPQTSSLAFRTWLDTLPDVTVASSINSLFMYGSNVAQAGASVYSPATSNWYNSLTINNNFPDSDGYSGGYNGDDLTASGTYTSNAGDFYDGAGWVTAKAYSWDSFWYTNLTTDYFDIIFNRTFTSTTDATGAYSFAGLPDGSYTVTLAKLSYMPATVTGTLMPGQTINLTTQVVKALPATLRGLIQNSYSGVIAGVTVTVTDPVGSRTAISDSEGNYRIDGIVDGNYTVTFAAPQLISQTLTGVISPGEVQVQNIWMSAAAVTLSVASPTEGALVSVVPLTVTGSTINAETVTIIAANNGVSVYYTAALVNDIYTIAIPVAAGQTSITVLATNKYHMHASKVVTVTRAPFTLSNVRDAGNVTVMELDGVYDAKNLDGSVNDAPRQAIAKEYLRTHGDSFDFLVYLSTFDYALPEAGAEGFYLPVRNEVQGINQPIFDYSAQYDSNSILQGTIDLGNISQLAAAPYGPLLDTNVRTLNHELGHRFGAYVRYKNPDGTLNANLLGKDSAHWSYLLDSKGSLMYGNGWKDNGDGTFTSTAIRNAFSPLDLYLMGMIPKEQVPPMLLIDNPTIDKTKLPHLGDTINGTTRTITIDDIIAAEGERIPNAATSQKQFNVGFVLLTRAGDNATSAIQAIETLRKAWAGRFAELTQNRGNVGNVPATLDINVGSPTDGTTITGPDVTVSGSFINSTGVETGVTVNSVPATVNGNKFIVNHVPLLQGSNSIEISATDVNGLTATTSRTVTAQPGHYIRIASNIESGIAPLDVSLRVESSFTVTNPQFSTSGTAAMEWFPWISETEAGVRITAEGTLAITVSAVGPDGQTYSDTVTLTALNRTKLENLLKAKWEGMKAAVISGATEDALKYFVFGIQDRIRAIIDDPESAISARLSEISRLDLFTATGRAIQAGAIRMESDGEFAYPVNFVTDENGVWKIMGF